MKVDINFEVEKASEFLRFCMNVRGINCIYVARYPNGVQCFELDEIEINNFCPKKIVSEVLKEEEERINAKYNNLIELSKEEGLHWQYKNGYERHAQSVLGKVGKIKFFAIVP
jgi:hypothetical protein